MADFLTCSQAVAADPSCAWPHAGQAALARCCAHPSGWVAADHWCTARAVAGVLEPAAAHGQAAHAEPADEFVHAAAVAGRQDPAVAAAVDADWRDAAAAAADDQKGTAADKKDAAAAADWDGVALCLH